MDTGPIIKVFDSLLTAGAALGVVPQEVGNSEDPAG
jgi:hypothetical protein